SRLSNLPPLRSLFLLLLLTAPAPTHIYTLSLHDALPISRRAGSPGSLRFHSRRVGSGPTPGARPARSPLLLPCFVGSPPSRRRLDRKSTRLNSSHLVISYAVFCLKKKKYNKHYSYFSYTL